MADIDPESQETGFDDLAFVTNIDQGDKLAYYRIFYELLPRFGFNVSFHSGAHDSAGSLLPGMERVLVKKDQSRKLSQLTSALEETPESRLLWMVSDRNDVGLDKLLFEGENIETGPIAKNWIASNRGFIESCLKTSLLRRAELARGRGQTDNAQKLEATSMQLEQEPLTEGKIREKLESKLIDLLRDHPELRP